MKRIYLIRHGQTAWNAEGRWQGILDVPLGETGIEQAKLLADALRARPITAIYSSDLSRAFATAEPLAQQKGLSIQTDERWREINFGTFQGLTHDEIRAKYPDEERQLVTNYMDLIMPEGESRRQMQNRAYAAWQHILANEPASEIAILTHGGPIRVLLMKLFPEQVDRMMKVPVPNTSVTIIAVDGDTLRLETLSSTAHLDTITPSDSP